MSVQPSHPRPTKTITFGAFRYHLVGVNRPDSYPAAIFNMPGWALQSVSIIRKPLKHSRS